MTRISLAERAAQIARKLEAGYAVPAAEDLRNSGVRRTVEKRRLLAALRREAKGQRRPLPFIARL